MISTRFASLVLFVMSSTTMSYAKLAFPDPGPEIKADADITYYLPGEPGPLQGKGACGIQNTVKDSIVALSYKYWDQVAALAGTGGNGNANPLCNLQIEITTTLGKEIATVTDRCADCERMGSVDVTPPLAVKLIGNDYLTKGRVTEGISWKFVDSPFAGSSSPSNGTVPPPPPPPSSPSPPAPPPPPPNSAGPEAEKPATARLPGQTSVQNTDPVPPPPVASSTTATTASTTSISTETTSSMSFDDGMYHSEKYAEKAPPQPTAANIGVVVPRADDDMGMRKRSFFKIANRDEVPQAGNLPSGVRTVPREVEEMKRRGWKNMKRENKDLKKKRLTSY